MKLHLRTHHLISVARTLWKEQRNLTLAIGLAVVVLIVGVGTAFAKLGRRSPSPVAETASPSPTTVVAILPSPSPTVSPLPSPTISPSPIPTKKPSPTPAKTPPPAPTKTPTPTATPTPTPAAVQQPAAVVMKADGLYLVGISSLTKSVSWNNFWFPVARAATTEGSLKITFSDLSNKTVTSAAIAPNGGALYLALESSTAERGEAVTTIYKVSFADLSTSIVMSGTQAQGGPILRQLATVSSEPNSLFYTSTSGGSGVTLEKIDITSKVVTVIGSGQGGVHFSPDGKHLAGIEHDYFTGGGSYYRVYTANLDGSQIHYFTGEDKAAAHVDWLDNQHLIYDWRASTNGTTTQISIINITDSSDTSLMTPAVVGRGVYGLVAVPNQQKVFVISNTTGRVGDETSSLLDVTTKQETTTDIKNVYAAGEAVFN